jgi:hypothetical protein
VCDFKQIVRSIIFKYYTVDWPWETWTQRDIEHWNNIIEQLFGSNLGEHDHSDLKIGVGIDKLITKLRSVIPGDVQERLIRDFDFVKVLGTIKEMLLQCNIIYTEAVGLYNARFKKGDEYNSVINLISRMSTTEVSLLIWMHGNIIKLSIGDVDIIRRHL